MCGADWRRVSDGNPCAGSSPRVRSRPVTVVAGGWSGGIISACAEQTRWLRGWRRRAGDHLRVCGADSEEVFDDGAPVGSSPRVRSRLAHRVIHHRVGGIISACAEQTPPVGLSPESGGDHLRVCGADMWKANPKGGKYGSSPRVRSRRLCRQVPQHARRIISACAEQTCRISAAVSLNGDHLRVCGADDYTFDMEPTGQGSSPRVRSRRKEVSRAGLGDGIISACAEQTEYGGASSREDGDHLRVCGADSATAITNMITTGSSPRVRSRRPCNCATTCNPGIISACAEQTMGARTSPCRRGDHLRVCGADYISDDDISPRLGSSPRVRSRPAIQTIAPILAGIISACAEQTGTQMSYSHITTDHLRVCGADNVTGYEPPRIVGSSPRVRSRPHTNGFRS